MNIATQNSPQIDPRSKENRTDILGQALKLATNEHLAALNEYALMPFPESFSDVEEYSRFFKLSDIIYAKDEDFLEKAVTILYTAYAINASVSVLLSSDGAHHSYYLGVSCPEEEGNISGKFDAFYRSVKGNFSVNAQSKDSDDKLCNSELCQDIDNIFSQSDRCISSISGVPALRHEDKHSVENFIQGIEQLTEAMRGASYTLMVQATPVSGEEVRSIRHSYEQIYTQLSPFAKTECSFNSSENWGSSTNESNTETPLTENRGTNKTKTLNSFGKAAVGLDTAVNCIKAGGGGLKEAIIDTVRSFGYSESNGENDSTTELNGENVLKTKTTGETKSEGGGTGRSIQYSFEDKTIQGIQETLEESLKRLKMCENYGTFSASAYVISNDFATNQTVSSLFEALMRGDTSFTQGAYIHTWEQNFKDIDTLKQYLSHLQHPVFQYPMGELVTHVTPAMIISGQELALQIALPKKSIPGIMVRESARFGCNPTGLNQEKSNDKSLDLGKVYHLGQSIPTPIKLSMEHLTGHTFVTGSTGSGKSNTIYQLLDESRNKNIHFLVIEPAKGEYKEVFGGCSDVTVYGTNPKLATLLKLNPFSFPDEIHVSEHIDRLLEIFNACWPMYAAMPAVLKEAMEEIYRKCGWDLKHSVNTEEVYPTFRDLLRELPIVMEQSDYSADTKGDYIGALVTRVKSLTNGINGSLFCGLEELPNEALFEENVIIDLSRVGSSETKSFIMGMLVLKLQEYRMSKGEINAPLKHITVLEEAHHLLRRTSTEQSQEGGNLQGKAVEMLTNSIAEMRTYGEGFIIADQSPSLLDLSVIRNTNTKIILRLPEQSDRELVGRAIALSEEQIVELSKLERGVATVYQNDWLEAVLCKVHHMTKTSPYIHPKEADGGAVYETLLNIVLEGSAERVAKQGDIVTMIECISKLNLSSFTRKHVVSLLQGVSMSEKIRKEILYNLTDGGTLVRQMVKGNNLESMPKKLQELYSLDELTAKKLGQILVEVALEPVKDVDTRKQLEAFLESGGGLR